MGTRTVSKIDITAAIIVPLQQHAQTVTNLQQVILTTAIEYN